MINNPEQLLAENKELRRQLDEANEALQAIRHGHVDAIIVEHPTGPQVYTLTGANEPYRVMVEEMQEGALTLREDAVIIYGNKQIAQMLHTTHEKLLGMSLHHFLATQSFPLFESLWQRCRNHPIRGELALVAADGIQIEVCLALNLLPSQGFNQISVVVTDLTEHKQHQKTIAAEMMARERAQHLAEEAQKKDSFLAMLAHELRTPLTPIRSGIDVLRLLPPSGEEAKQVLHMMETQTHHLVRLVDDLLDVSRVTCGKIELKRERVALNAIITNAIQTVEPLIQEKEHELTVMPATESIYVHGDPTRLAQIVANLLNNAAKYTHPGGKILLATQKVGSEAHIRIKDNGTGIEAKILPCIFDLFVQADSSLCRSQGGLGIGLSLVKSLVTSHGGTIEATSEGLGKGSEFTVRLPILHESELVRPAATVTPKAKTFSSRRILLVDDTKSISYMIATLLRKWNQHVRTAESGAEALQMIEQEKPHLILSDISMPEMNGYELAQTIRRRPEWNDIYLVALTGYGQENDKKMAKEAGFNGHLVKPINKKDIEHLLSLDISPDLCMCAVIPN